MNDRARPFVLGAAAFVLAAALLALAALPTGAAAPDGVVPVGSRVVTSAAVGGARAILASDSGQLRVHVAYRGPKRWLGVALDPAPLGAVAAWAGTPGEAGVPSLSVVYGRITAETVRVEWADGSVNEVRAESDGAYLVARRGRVQATKVLARAADGRRVFEVPGP